MRALAFAKTLSLVVLCAPMLAGCEPSDDDYANAARAMVERGCCEVGGPKCTKCPLLEGARITSTEVTNCCAGSGKLVSVVVDGPKGKGVCNFNAMKNAGKIDVNMGRCQPK